MLNDIPQKRIWGPAAEQFFVIFLEKNTYFNAISIIFRLFLLPFEITKFLDLKAN